MKINGTVISKGIIVGKLHFLSSSSENKEAKKKSSMNLIDTFYSTQSSVKNDIDTLINNLEGSVDSSIIDIFKAHKMMIEDPHFTNEVIKKIHVGETLSTAIEATITTFIKELSDKEDSISRRIGDFQEILIRFQSYILESTLKTFDEDTILICDELTPYEFMHYKDHHVKGFILKHGSELSHTSFLAKSFNIPMIITPDFHGDFGDDIVTFNTYDSTITRGSSFIEKGEKKALPGIKFKHVTLSLNLISTDNLPETSPSFSGVGLFRTEFLSENPFDLVLEKQLEAYQTVLNHFHDQDVVLRVFDFSNDKSLGSDIIEESLVWLLEHHHLFTVQLSAMFQSNTKGNLSILLPMVTSKIIFERAYKLIKEMANKYATAPFKLGIMIEKIAILDDLKDILPYVDFISIGTNDLSADLTKTRRDQLITSQQLDGHLLELIETITTLAKDANVSVSVCGEFAHDRRYINHLIRLGVDRLSMDYQYLEETINYLNTRAYEE